MERQIQMCEDMCCLDNLITDYVSTRLGASCLPKCVCSGLSQCLWGWLHFKALRMSSSYRHFLPVGEVCVCVCVFILCVWASYRRVMVIHSWEELQESSCLSVTSHLLSPLLLSWLPFRIMLSYVLAFTSRDKRGRQPAEIPMFHHTGPERNSVLHQVSYWLIQWRVRH